jgi:hypothetical protein
MAFRATHRALLGAFVLCATCVSACGGGLLGQEYEYEEEIYLALDGSATVNVNASVAALVALRGADLDPDPRARLDRERVRALFGGSGGDVSVSVWRRDGRRYLHVSVEVDDVRQASRIAPFAWSTYRFDRQGDVFEFRQAVGPPAGSRAADPGWTGAEMVSFKMHLPSEIVFHNAPSGQVERGNILVWEQPLADRLAGVPLQLQVQLEPESILFTTLMLFGTTVAAAAAAFALAVWWIARKGRDAEMAGSPP